MCPINGYLPDQKFDYTQPRWSRFLLDDGSVVSFAWGAVDPSVAGVVLELPDGRRLEGALSRVTHPDIPELGVDLRVFAVPIAGDAPTGRLLAMDARGRVIGEDRFNCPLSEQTCSS
jgi:hypothetical protein